MTLTSVTSPYYLTINQSEIIQELITYPVTISLTLPLNTLPCTPLACAGLLSMSHHIPCDYLPHLAFKNPSPKSIGECWSFEHEPSISPPWPHVRHLAINTVIFFHHNSVSVDWLHWAWASRPRFGSIIEGLRIFFLIYKFWFNFFTSNYYQCCALCSSFILNCI